MRFPQSTLFPLKRFLRSLSLGILLTTGLSVYAQSPSNYCATVQPEESLTWLRNWQANHQDAHPEFKRSGDDYLIPIKVHIVGTDAGTGYYRLDLLLEAFCDLNVQFDSTGFHFYIAGDINYINNSAYYAHDYFNGSRMMLENNIQQMVNMYFVSDPAGACGYYTYGPDAIAIAKSCASDGNSTIAHELGHYFSLPHTFRGWEGGTAPVFQQEKVDRSNCSSAGDGFCGTGPDYAAYRWNCPTTGPFTDPNGESFVPDGTFYMSYSNDGCTTRFSDDQKEAMNDFLVGPRDDLLLRPAPTLLTHEPVEGAEPLDGELNTDYSYTVLKWNKDPNATYYHVAIGLNATMGAISHEAFVTDTFYIAPELPKLRKHYWHVKPLSQGNTCTPYSTLQTFTTGEVASGLLNLTAAAADLQSFPNPLLPGQAIQTVFTSQQSQEIVMVLSGMDGRVYTQASRLALAGENRLSWDMPLLPEGLYLLEIRATGQSGVSAQDRWVSKVSISQ